MICFIDGVKYETKSGNVDAKFYLMQHLYDVDPDENRERIWCSRDKALSELTHTDSKYILEEAERRRKR